jgi:hypothetical protein
MKVKPEWILRLVGIVVLEAIDRWRQGSAKRAERRLRRHAERLRTAPVETVDDGYKRKGEP